MPDEPARFTDEQRETFRRVALLVRGAPSEFAEAGRWLDCGADVPRVGDRLTRVRNSWLPEARSRRHVGERQGRAAGRAYLVPPAGPTLKVSRTILARSIRAEREVAGLPPAPFDVIQHAAMEFVNNPPNYDAMRPDLAARHAHRVLLVAWLLSDPHDLETISSLRS